jgi:hypothetical protein
MLHSWTHERLWLTTEAKQFRRDRRIGFFPSCFVDSKPGQLDRRNS